MIGGDFITFGNNQLKMTQLSHTPEVFLFTLFTAPKPMQLPLLGVEGACVATQGGRLP